MSSRFRPMLAARMWGASAALRKRWPVTLGAMVVAVLLGAGAGAWWYEDRVAIEVSLDPPGHRGLAGALVAELDGARFTDDVTVDARIDRRTDRSWGVRVGIEGPREAIAIAGSDLRAELERSAIGTHAVDGVTFSEVSRRQLLVEVVRWGYTGVLGTVAVLLIAAVVRARRLPVADVRAAAAWLNTRPLGPECSPAFAATSVLDTQLGEPTSVIVTTNLQLHEPALTTRLTREAGGAADAATAGTILVVSLFHDTPEDLAQWSTTRLRGVIGVRA